MKSMCECACRSTFAVVSAALRVAGSRETSPKAGKAPTVPAPPATMLMTSGSSNQVPVRPSGARAVMTTPGSTTTWAADVSTNPPSPPAGALTSRRPATLTKPPGPGASSRIRPFSPVAKVRASIRPAWLTVALGRSPAAVAVSSTSPPGARIAPPLATSASTAPCSKTSPTTPPRESVTLPAAASRTLPWAAEIDPSFRTLAATRTTKPPWPSGCVTILPWLTTAADEAPAKA